MPNARSLSGFTLIEVMTTLAITGIMASIAIPSLTGTVKRSNQIEEIEKVKEFVAIARDRARSERRCVQLYLDPEGAIMTTFQTCDNVRRYGSSTPTLSDPMPSRALLLKHGVTLSKEQTLIFTPWGGLANAQNADLYFMDAQKSLRRVQILAGLGVISEKIRK